MAEPKRPRVRREKSALNDEEMRVMKHVRFQVKMEDGKLQGTTIAFFSGSAVVDCLMKSKYAGKAPAASATTPYFPDRKSAVSFMNRAMQTAGLFMRVDRRKRRSEREGDTEKSRGLRKRTTASSDKTEGAGTSNKEADTEKEKKDSEKKSKRTPKLLIHEEQAFLDSETAIYMWNYDPIRPRNVVLGLLVVVAAIAICLYPIWPRDLQIYTAYASRGGLVIVGLLLAVLLLRYVIASVVYMVSFGRVSFWLFPNLNDEKLGVADSFKPVYTLTFNEKSKEKSKEKEKNKSSVSKKGKEERHKKGGDERADIAKGSSDDDDKKRSKKSGSSKGKKQDAKPVPDSPTPMTAESSSAPTEAQVAPIAADEDEDSQYEVINKDEL